MASAELSSDAVEPSPSKAPPAAPSAEAAELTRLRLKVLALSAENERLQNTISYQLGHAIVRAKHWRGLIALPSELAHMVVESRRRQGRRKLNEKAPPTLEVLLRRMLNHHIEPTAEQIIASIEAENQPLRTQATILTEVGKILRATDAAKALQLIRHAATLDPSARRSVQLATMLWEAGQITEPQQIFARLTAQRAILTKSAQNKADLLDGMARVNASGLTIPTRRPVATTPAEAKSVLYLAASSLPYHTTGYTSRTHALVRAMAATGWTVHAATRPGYPQDRNDIHVMSEGPVQTVDGVDYHLLPGPRSNTTPFDKYCQSASASIGREIERTRPALVHAASNYLSATPALIAARKAGLPFVYEVRGLWELTHAAKDPAFEGSERFEWQKRRESELAREADMVVTISNGLKSELISRGVDEDRIVVTPNCVDPDVFMPRRQDRALAKEYALGDSHVLGFIGSMTSYEGLIDLVSALAELRGAGHDVCALLVGDGAAAGEVREAARSLGVQHHLIMPGRVPHADVTRWYSLMDVAVYPRRPSRVTELVPPLKPLEAMAMGLPVVASDVSAIRESVIHEHNGLLFERGNVAHLVETLDRSLTDRKLTRRLARQGRADIKRLYTWQAAARRLGEAYQSRLFS